MWWRLFTGPWPETENLLPAAVQQQAAQQIRNYWITRGWQLVLGEVALWAVATFRHIPHDFFYAVLAGMIGAAYVLSMLRGFTMTWLVGSMVMFLTHGMLVEGLGAVTALSFMMPYTVAGMLLSGRNRIFVQVCCTIAFWVSLIYDVGAVFPQLSPPDYILVGYNILLAAFTFQTLRFLNRLTIAINTAHVAEEVQQRSQQFLARVSHELRTPLNSVLGFAKLLRRAELSDAQRSYLAQIIDEGEQLNRLVSDLLDSAHLSTGKVTLDLALCDVNAICESVAAEHRPGLPPAVALRLALEPALPPVRADRVRLRQVVGNLLSNAVKYTEAGTITVRTFAQDGAVFIEVEDTGMGIPESQQQLVFTPFVQLDTRRVGVGLGLDIALRLARLHGGDIHLRSAPGQGSTFTVELPACGVD